MDLTAKKPQRRERTFTFVIVVVMTLASIILMLRFTSPELSWDEADYVSSVPGAWKFLWQAANYSRHAHGPMAIYLAKLGLENLPAGVNSLEHRLRFFEAMIGSLAVGCLYWILRRLFGTSHAGAFAGAGLLLFSVIRVQETNMIGPHQLMLLCTIGIAGLGYHWRDRPGFLAALGLGAVIGFGALSMTYVVPAVACWIAAVTLSGGKWITGDRGHFKLSWWMAIIPLTAAAIVLACWPPGMLQGVFFTDFWFYRNYLSHPTLVGPRIYEITPRWAVLYWLAHLEWPILFFSAIVFTAAVCRAICVRRLSSKHVYLFVTTMFYLATMLAAHIAGARNLLQFVGVLCLVTGALLDEVVGLHPRSARLSGVAIVLAAALNFIWLAQSSSYIPFLATDGYRAFLRENQSRFNQRAKAWVYGTPVLRFYELHEAISPAWDVREMPWTTRANVHMDEDVKYVLMPAFIADDMPADQPMRRVVAAHWKKVWSFKEDHVWELQLYERPEAGP